MHQQKSRYPYDGYSQQCHQLVFSTLRHQLLSWNRTERIHQLDSPFAVDCPSQHDDWYIHMFKEKQCHAAEKGWYEQHMFRPAGEGGKNQPLSKEVCTSSECICALSTICSIGIHHMHINLPTCQEGKALLEGYFVNMSMVTNQ